MTIPRSPLDEIDGLIYFRRMCDKIRLSHSGSLHPDYHANLGLAMDLWTCQFLGIQYENFAEKIKEGLSDEDALEWAKENGVARSDFEHDWWSHYMKTRGFRDNLSERLAQRKAENGWEERDDIQTFMDYIVADESA